MADWRGREALGGIGFQDVSLALAGSQLKKSVLALRYIEELLDASTAGEKLPSEREIAEHLGMTRSPVREALVALQMAGRVQIEAGVGAFSTGGERKPSDAAVTLLADNESPFEVRQLRQALEAAIVRSAIAELTPRSLRDMKDAFDQMRLASQDEDVATFIDAHRGFHFAIARASHNSLFERLSQWILYSVMTQPVWEIIMHRRLNETDTRLSDSISEHRDLLEAIEARDPEQATLLMRRHFLRVL